jgi:hypothetical protein
MASYAVTCATCKYQRSCPTRERAQADAAVHADANPTHSVGVHQER